MGEHLNVVMKKLLNITCKEATLLLCKKEQNALSFFEMIKLRLHMGICSMCRLFEKQSLFIKINAKHEHIHAILNKEVKEKIKLALENEQ